MSYSSMVAAATIPPGQPGSLFKLPCSDGLAELLAAKSSFDFLGTAVTASDVTFDSVYYIDRMDTTLNLIQNHLTQKIADTPAQLSACVSASQFVKRAQEIDSAVVASGYPDVIKNAFPSRLTATDSIVTGAFTTLTDCTTQVNTCTTAVNASFDSFAGVMTILYQEIGNAGGPTITTGEQMLAYLGAASDPVKVAVTTVIDTNVSVQTAIKGAFLIADGAFTALNSSFSASLAAESSVWTFVTNQLKGNAAVSILNSKSPDVAAVLSTCVDFAQVSSKALVISQKLNTAPIPGESVVKSVKTQREIEEKNAPAVSPTPGPDQKYSEAQISAMNSTFSVQENTVSALERELGYWLKANIEDWKPTVDYNSKRLAAGYSEEHPDGTNPSAYIRGQWIAVRDQAASRMSYYNSTLLPRYTSALTALKLMKLERERRIHFGKNPYSFLASRGEVVPENEQTIYFDTTK